MGPWPAAAEGEPQRDHSRLQAMLAMQLMAGPTAYLDDTATIEHAAAGPLAPMGRAGRIPVSTERPIEREEALRAARA